MRLLWPRVVVGDIVALHDALMDTGFGDAFGYGTIDGDGKGYGTRDGDGKRYGFHSCYDWFPADGFGSGYGRMDGSGSFRYRK